MTGQHQVFLVTATLCRMWRELLRKRLQSVLAEDHPKGSPQGPSTAEKPRQSLIPSHSSHSLTAQLSNSLESKCFALTMYDGYDNDTFLMFVSTICIISSHKLSSARIRHEADMRTSSSIHALSDASLRKSAEHVSSFMYHRLLTSLIVRFMKYENHDIAIAMLVLLVLTPTLCLLGVFKCLYQCHCTGWRYLNVYIRVTAHGSASQVRLLPTNYTQDVTTFKDKLRVKTLFTAPCKFLSQSHCPGWFILMTMTKLYYVTY